MDKSRHSALVSWLRSAILGVATVVMTGPLCAQTTSVTTDPVGYLTVALPASSDTFVSLPFTRPVEFTGAVASVATTGTTPNTVGTLTFSASTFSAASQFAPLSTVAPNDGHKTYYAIIGPKNAALTPTLSVTNASTSVTASAALPTDLVAGDTVTVAGYTFTIVAVPSTTTLTLDRVYPGTTANGQAATYDHSPSEGRFYSVTANDTGSLTVNLNGDTLSNVAAGTQISVVPYWTLATIFPATDAGTSFLASVGTQPRNRGTQIQIPDLSSPGTNLAPNLIYYFYNSAWRSANDSVTTNVHDDDVLLPDTYFIARNVSSTGVTAAALTLVPKGSVPINRISTPLTAQVGTPQDNAVTVARPAPVTLNDLGLITSRAFVASTGTTPRTRGDQLLVYDNAAVGTNKGASAIYYYYNSAWRLAGDATLADVGATVILQPSTGLTIRKASVATTTPTAFWQNPRNYLN